MLADNKYIILMTLKPEDIPGSSTTLVQGWVLCSPSRLFWAN